MEPVSTVMEPTHRLTTCVCVGRWNEWAWFWSGHALLSSLSRNTVTSARTILDDIGNMFDDLADQLDAMLD